MKSMDGGGREKQHRLRTAIEVAGVSVSRDGEGSRSMELGYTGGGPGLRTLNRRRDQQFDKDRLNMGIHRRLCLCVCGEKEKRSEKSLG